MQDKISRQGPPAAAPKGRLAIIAAAQAAFSESGYGGVSLREIAKRAGVSLTLVDHHFGAKHELFSAVIDSWRGAVSDSLVPLTALVAAGPAPGGDEQVIETLYDALRQLATDPRGRNLLLLNLRSRFDDDPRVTGELIALFLPLAQAFVDALAQLHPRLPRSDLAWVYLLVRGALVESMSGDRWMHAIAGVPPERQPNGDVEATRWFIAAGVRGCLQAAERQRAA